MGIKKLGQAQLANKKVGIIGTLKGTVQKLNVGETSTGKPYANGAILVDGSDNPTNFSVFTNKKNEDLVDQFIAMCQDDAEIVIMASAEQDDYENQQGQKRRSTKIKVINVVDKSTLKENQSHNTLSIFGHHIEDGTVYGPTQEGGTYLVFKIGCRQTWFDKDKKEEKEKVDVFELRAYNEVADKIAEDMADVKDGEMVFGRVQPDGQRLIIKSLSVAPPAAAEGAEGAESALD